ncbi:hypothetical protein AcV5_009447 [Taiwanofungus camphoratus]|nr:hypothetical protein AcV5_009447 [Antrodia cinnamomea]
MGPKSGRTYLTLERGSALPVRCGPSCRPHFKISANLPFLLKVLFLQKHTSWKTWEMVKANGAKKRQDLPHIGEGLGAAGEMWSQLWATLQNLGQPPIPPGGAVFAKTHLLEDIEDGAQKWWDLPHIREGLQV